MHTKGSRDFPFSLFTFPLKMGGMTRIVFMGTPDFAVPSLQALIQTGQVVGVVTQPDRPAGRGNKLRKPPVKIAAEEAGLPIYQPKSLRKKAAAEPIAYWKPDLIVVAAFGQILRPHLLEMPRLGCVNVHASLLPRWRGASPIQSSLLAGDAKTGVTLMQMNEGLDTGDMLAKASLEIGDDETAVELHDRLAALGGDLLITHFASLISGTLTATPQDDELSTYATLIRKTDGQLNWNETAVELYRRLRAFTPWPGVYTKWQGKNLKILSATPFETEKPMGAVGEVVSWDGDAAVQTSSGLLRLHTVQLAGKKATRVADFVRGRGDFIGSNLLD